MKTNKQDRSSLPMPRVSASLSFRVLIVISRLFRTSINSHLGGKAALQERRTSERRCKYTGAFVKLGVSTSAYFSSFASPSYLRCCLFPRMNVHQESQFVGLVNDLPLFLHRWSL